MASIRTSGQCGFPGRPLNGQVFIEEDSRGTGRGAVNSSKTSDDPYVANNSTGQYSRFTEQINETTWNNEELHRVVYRYDNDLWMGDDGSDEYYRECVDGKWTGDIPQCGESRV